MVLELEGGEQTSDPDETSESRSTNDAVGLGAGAIPPSPANSHAETLGLKQLSLPGQLPSIVDIKRVMPQHVFQAKVSTSMYYALKDVGQLVLLFLLADWLWSSGLLPRWALLALLPGYWLLQGTFFTALFVVGHDAGHGSFSRHAGLNDAVGNAMHGFLLCPYYCWKLSHRQHHKNTGNMDKDEVFYPIRRSQDKGGFTLPGFGLGLGWFCYLVLGYGPRPVAHFNPFHPTLRQKFLPCAISLAVVAAWAGVLCQYALTAGFWKLFVHYLVPDFIFASYTVVITFLHHTEENVPWYDDSVWDNVRGQLSSVDRDYGWCHQLLHSIGTHQIHHLFSKVPHYHLQEATAVFRRQFPQLVRVRDDAILPAFWRMFRKYLAQYAVPDSTKVFLYK